MIVLSLFKNGVISLKNVWVIFFGYRLVVKNIEQIIYYIRFEELELYEDLKL